MDLLKTLSVLSIFAMSVSAQAFVARADNVDVVPAVPLHKAMYGQPVSEGDETWKLTVYIWADAHACTATILDRDLLLTAAHCFPEGKPKQFFVRMYRGSSMSEVWEMSGDDIAIKIHSRFRKGEESVNAAHDIAVVALRHHRFQEPHKPVSFVGLDQADRIKVGATVTAAGTGRTLNRAKQVALKRVSARITRYDGDEVTIRTRGGQACLGDSGGPLFIETRTGLYQFGVDNRMLDLKAPQVGCASEAVYAFISDRNYREMIRLGQAARSELTVSPTL